MSFARFGPGSDVYIYASGRGLECCGCALEGSVTVDTAADMRAHLDDHRAAGHLVPDGLDAALERYDDEELRSAVVEASED